MNSQSTMIFTGASQGIGKALIDHYVKSGCQIIGLSRSGNDLECKNYTDYKVDITDEKSVSRVFSEINEKFEKIDTLVNVAGIAKMNHSLTTPLSSVKDVFNTNVIATFHLCQEAAKLMLGQNNGRIINFSSVAAPLNLAGEAAYASSKAALESLTKTMSKELAGRGITVNCVAPTLFPSKMTAGLSEDKKKAIHALQSIKRDTELSDITNVIDFFNSEKSGFITGQTIYFGGICV